MGHPCESCCYWRGDSMWKGNPCGQEFEPGDCDQPWQMCPFCKEAFTDDKCLSDALARIAALEAENEWLREEDRRDYKDMRRFQSEFMRAESALAAARGTIDDMTEHQVVLDYEIKRLRLESAAAYERGAREFAEWVVRAEMEDYIYWAVEHGRHVSSKDLLARFLASRGTAEGNGEEG